LDLNNSETTDPDKKSGESVEFKKNKLSEW